MKEPEARMKLYAQAGKTLVKEAAILPLFYARMQRLVKPWVRRLHVSAYWGWFLKDVIVESH
jgi:ABC-type oligopeptide transport system substrate-binding subunit